tara:strand:+ start:1261 stop:2136 length:876 start_codon:yes stop_codon:yes gene_type:complete
MKTKVTLSHRNKEPENGILYLVGTPIGNLNDISIRAINILRGVSLIACEDTRKTGKLLKYFDISNKLISFHKYNSINKVDFLINKLREDASIALVSDAGMPLISDPGEIIVKKAKENNFDIICVPGPCAAISALVSSGIDTSRFTFYGFIPKSTLLRKSILRAIWESKNTSIIYESPKRVLKLLNDLKEICGGDRNIVLMKELTKRFERHYGNNINDVIKEIEFNEPKGEFTLIISGNSENSLVNKISLIEDLRELINAGLSNASASNYLSKKSGFSKNEIYKLSIKNSLK